MTHYLDHAAGTSVRSVAVEAMLPLLTTGYGNPSGSHRLAREANRVLDDAREVMAEALGAHAGEIVFTSGGTEADNLAVQGTLAQAGGMAVCSAGEHHAVLDPVEFHRGLVVPLLESGLIDLEALARVLESAPMPITIVSVMLANNETGVIQPLGPVIELVRALAPQAVVHTDAVQALCWVDVATEAAAADLISVSAHKFGGPKGVGALVVRDGVKLAPLARGGGQEKGRRNGTQNVPGVAAMAAAAAASVADRATEIPRIRTLRDRLADGIRSALPGVHESAVPGSVEQADRSGKLANICHLAFEGIESEAMLFLLEKHDVLASAASSCSSGAQDPSHVLAAMGMSRELAGGSLRLSLGHTSSDEDVDVAIKVVPTAVERLRSHATRFPSAGVR